MRRDYAEFVFPGLLVAESSVRPVHGTRPIPPEEWPKGAVGYRFFHRFEMRDRTEGGETIILKSEGRGHTPWTYAGTELTVDDAARLHGEDSILVGNMRGNGMERVVDVGGHVWPLSEGDSVIIPQPVGAHVVHP